MRPKNKYILELITVNDSGSNEVVRAGQFIGRVGRAAKANLVLFTVPVAKQACFAL